MGRSGTSRLGRSSSLLRDRFDLVADADPPTLHNPCPQSTAADERRHDPLAGDLLQMNAGRTIAQPFAHHHADPEALADQRGQRDAACGDVAPVLVESERDPGFSQNGCQGLLRNEGQFPRARIGRGRGIEAGAIAVAVAHQALTSNGLDLAATTGTPIHAPTAGVVAYAREFYYSGNTVIIDHGLGLYSTMAHLSVIGVKEGARVARGDLLGEVGATGRVTGPHLHWAVRILGARVDPLSLLDVLAAAP